MPREEIEQRGELVEQAIRAAYEGSERPKGFQGKTRAESHWWAREYLKTGTFPQPRQLRQVQPGEVLVMHSGAEFDLGSTRWWIHMFLSVFSSLDECVPEEELQRTGNAFESFCLSTPWGALYHAVSPPPRSAERMANRLASLLRFWDVLQGPRYAFWPGRKYTLDELMEDIYRKTLEAWCPGGPASVREHMALKVQRMSRALRKDCEEAGRALSTASASRAEPQGMERPPISGKRS